MGIKRTCVLRVRYDLFMTAEYRYVAIVCVVATVVMLAIGGWVYLYAPLQSVLSSSWSESDEGEPALEIPGSGVSPVSLQPHAPAQASSTTQTREEAFPTYNGPLPAAYNPAEPSSIGDTKPVRTPDETRVADLNTIKAALQKYAGSHQGQYPPALPADLPKDPAGKGYAYYTAGDLVSYTTCALLSIKQYACVDSALDYPIYLDEGGILPSADEWTSYRDPSGLYSFSYPDAWEMTSVDDNPQLWASHRINLNLPIKDSRGDIYKNLGGDSLGAVQLWIMQITAQGDYTFDDYVQGIVATMRQYTLDPTRGLSDLTVAVETFGGRSATKVTYAQADTANTANKVLSLTTVYYVPTGAKTGITLTLFVNPSRAFEKFTQTVVRALVERISI